MSINHPNPTRTRLSRARAALGRLRLPWRVWLKIVAGVLAIFVATGLNFPNPLTNWLLGAITIAWVAAYITWHVRR